MGFDMGRRLGLKGAKTRKERASLGVYSFRGSVGEREGGSVGQAITWERVGHGREGKAWGSETAGSPGRLAKLPRHR